MQLKNSNGTRWNFYGCMVFLVLPFVPWFIYNYKTELIVSQFHEGGASIIRAVALTILVVGWTRFFIGPKKTFARKTGAESGNANALPQSTFDIAATFNPTSSDVSPPHNVQQAIRLIEQVVPKGSYDSLSIENKALSEVNVYLQYGRVAQALSMLQEIAYPSTTTKQLIKILTAVTAASDGNASS